MAGSWIWGWGKPHTTLAMINPDKHRPLLSSTQLQKDLFPYKCPYGDGLRRMWYLSIIFSLVPVLGIRLFTKDPWHHQLKSPQATFLWSYHPHFLQRNFTPKSLLWPVHPHSSIQKPPHLKSNPKTDLMVIQLLFFDWYSRTFDVLTSILWRHKWKDLLVLHVCNTLKTKELFVWNHIHAHSKCHHLIVESLELYEGTILIKVVKIYMSIRTKRYTPLQVLLV